MERVKYNPTIRGEQTIKTASKSFILQLDEGIRQAQRNGNQKLVNALNQRLKEFYLIDYQILNDICDLQD